MRTTLDIDTDVLQAAKEIAAMRKSTAGKVLSDLARQALRPPDTTPQMRNGIPLLPAREGERPVSLKIVNQLRDED